MRRHIAALALFTGCGPSQDDFDALQAQVDDQADDIATLKTDVATLDTRVTAIEQTLANAAGGDLAALGEAIADLGVDLDAAEAAITTLQGSMTTAQTDIDTLQSDVGELGSDMTAALGDIGDLQDDLLALTGRVGTLDALAGNDKWAMTGLCDCNTTASSTWQNVTGAGLTITTEKAGPILLVAQNVVGSANADYRLKVTQLTGGSWSTTTTEVGVYTAGDTEVTLIGIITPPAVATYQVLIEAKGAAINREHGIVGVQLTLAP